jgi:hypothetical protein
MNAKTSPTTFLSNSPEQAIRTLVWERAKELEGDSLELLSLLRTLEALHRQIRTELFEPILPERRNDLYSLVRDIAESGGWPYIERMRLQQLLANLERDGDPETRKLP